MLRDLNEFCCPTHGSAGCSDGSRPCCGRMRFSYLNISSHELVSTLVRTAFLGGFVRVFAVQEVRGGITEPLPVQMSQPGPLTRCKMQLLTGKNPVTGRPKMAICCISEKIQNAYVCPIHCASWILSLSCISGFLNEL